jgi:hypothetical protein
MWQADLPQSVAGMIDKKTADLATADQDLLRAASLQGMDFDSAVLSRALRISPLDVEHRLADLEERYGIVKIVGETRMPDASHSLRCRFAHVLYREAVCSSMGPAQRRLLSAGIAEAVKALYDGAKHHLTAAEVRIGLNGARQDSYAG